MRPGSCGGIRNCLRGHPTGYSEAVRLLDVRLDSDRAVDASLDMGKQVLVLFGPNDAGKTNTLEALITTLKWGLGLSVREQEPSRVAGQDSAVFTDALIELDRIGEEGSPDRALLAQLLQFKVSNVQRQPRVGPREIEAFPTYREPNERQVCGHSFTLGSEPLILAEVLRLLKENTLLYASDGCSAWPEVIADFELLLDACLSSRWIEWIARDGPWWGCPRPEECLPSWREAAERLLARRDTWQEWPPPMIGGLVEQLTTKEGLWSPLEWLGDESTDLLLWNVVARLGDQEGSSDIAKRIEEHLGKMTRRFLVRGASGRIERAQWTEGPMPWFDEMPDGTYSVRPAIVQSLEALCSRATQIAPSFVTSDYDIEGRVIPPTDWDISESRIAVRLLRSDGEAFPLGLTGSGIRRWATYAIIEAMRQIEHEVMLRSADEDLDKLPILDVPDFRGSEDLEPGTPTVEDPELTAEFTDQLVFVIDEPELHLHPLAQEQAAAWICELVESNPDARVIMATHSPVFLNLPRSDGVEYMFVRRHEDGKTRTVAVTSDMIGALEEVIEAYPEPEGAGIRLTGAEVFGLRPVDVVQLIRKVLVIEGLHDEMVVRRFFSRELAEARCLILPLGGSVNLSVSTVEMMTRLGMPVTIVLDNVRDEALKTGSLPRGYRPSDEAKKLRNILIQLHGLMDREPGLVRGAPFDEPDVLCALPEESVRSLLSDCGQDPRAFPGWEATKQLWASSGEGSVKKWLVRHLGLEGIDPNRHLVPRLIDRCPPESAPARSLQVAIRTALGES